MKIHVEEWKPGIYEVEFADQDGHAYAFTSIPESRLIPLRFEPQRQAADTADLWPASKTSKIPYGAAEPSPRTQTK